MKGIETYLRTFFAKLNERGVVYAVARNWGTLPISLNGSDLDIIAGDEKELQVVLQISAEVARECGGVIVSYYRVEGAVICLGGKIANGDWWGCHIDVFTGFKFHGFEYLDDKPVVASRVLERGVFYRCDKYVDSIAFFKELMANGRDKNGYYAGARREYVCDKEGLMTALISRFGTGCCERICSILTQECSTEEIRAQQGTFYHSLMREFSRRYGVLGCWRLKCENYWHRFVRIFDPPGASVAFLGTDGSGKSTLIDNVKPVVEQMLHSQVHYEHLRPNLLPSLARVVGKSQQIGPTTNPHGGKSAGWISSLARFFYYYIDYIIGYWVKIFPKLVKRPTMVVFDRYYYEYMIDPKRCAVRLLPGFARFFSWFIPKPDLILCLGGDPEKIYARKPETSLKEVTRQIVALKDFCENNKCAVWIDTTGDVEESKNAALTAIVQMMSKRYK